MSIVRVGLGEERSFAAGYDAIFGGGKGKATAKKEVVVAAKKGGTKAKPQKAPAKKAKKK